MLSWKSSLGMKVAVWWKVNLFHYSTIPLYHYSTIPLFHYTTIPLFHYSTIPIPNSSRRHFISSYRLSGTLSRHIVSHALYLVILSRTHFISSYCIARTLSRHIVSHALYLVILSLKHPEYVTLNSRLWSPTSYSSILLLLLKPAPQTQVGKTKLVTNWWATSRAPAPPKTEKTTTQGSNQRLTAPLNLSSIPVSNTV